jgi:hypothetical protein
MTLPPTKPLPRPLAALLCAAALAAAGPAAAEATACSDFDEYVNGRWKAATELPPDRARIGSFDTLAQANDRLLEAALKELAADPARQTSPGLKLLASYYRSGMDEAAIERQGLRAVQPLLPHPPRPRHEVTPCRERARPRQRHHAAARRACQQRTAARQQQQRPGARRPRQPHFVLQQPVLQMLQPPV